MRISGLIPQLRTADLAESIRFYTTKIELTLEFQYQNSCAGIRAGNQIFHLKLVCRMARARLAGSEREHPRWKAGVGSLAAEYRAALLQHGAAALARVGALPRAAGRLVEIRMRDAVPE